MKFRHTLVDSRKQIKRTSLNKRIRPGKRLTAAKKQKGIQS